MEAYETDIKTMKAKQLENINKIKREGELDVVNTTKKIQKELEKSYKEHKNTLKKNYKSKVVVTYLLKSSFFNL